MLLSWCSLQARASCQYLCDSTKLPNCGIVKVMSHCRARTQPSASCQQGMRELQVEPVRLSVISICLWLASQWTQETRYSHLPPSACWCQSCRWSPQALTGGPGAQNASHVRQQPPGWPCWLPEQQVLLPRAQLGCWAGAACLHAKQLLEPGRSCWWKASAKALQPGHSQMRPAATGVTQLNQLRCHCQK